jgi:pre-mRNA-splicing factor 18
MDFAALMSKELAKVKAKTESSSSSKKYVKRSEAEAERKAAYLEQQKALEDEREAKAAAKRKREDEIAAENKAREEKRRRLAEESRLRQEEEEAGKERARRKRLGLSELPRPGEDADNGGGVEGEDIPEEELLMKLRDLGEPTVLFGETHSGRVRRYKRLTTVISKGPIPTTIQLVEEKDMKVDATVPKDKDGRKWLFRQLASYFTMVLVEWERALEKERSDTTASKTAYNAMVQSRDNLKPVCTRARALYAPPTRDKSPVFQ